MGRDEGLKGNKRRIKNQKGVKTKFGLIFGRQKREEEEEEEERYETCMETMILVWIVWMAMILYGKV